MSKTDYVQHFLFVFFFDEIKLQNMYKMKSVLYRI